MSVTLKSGEEVKVNDHVYYAPPLSLRDTTPWSIARVMEFLPHEGDHKTQKTQCYDRVRLAWYYRPADVTDRPVADPRLLLAAIYSEVADINHLRGKCYVVHRDKISDLAGWKKRPDRFYFNRLYDPYIKREFEVISCKDVRNIPHHVREVLISRYEYVVAEKEVIPDLTDSIRLCHTCEAWCPNPETVQCDRCKKYFHMSCVHPPLLAKPSRGYGWTCAPCSREHEEEVDSRDLRLLVPVLVKPKSNAPAPRGRGRPRKDRTQAEKEENCPVKHFQMWPFRYFGQYTVAEDTLDPDDNIFPRTATRVGPKFQVTVPPIPAAGPSSESEERGGDHTVEVLSLVIEMVPAEVSEMEALMKNLAREGALQHNVDYLTEVIRRYSETLAANKSLASVNMKSPMRLEKWKKLETRYIDKPWSRDEIVAFEDTILDKGPELRAVRDEIGTRTLPEVVRFYGHWKNSRLAEENVRSRGRHSLVSQEASFFQPRFEGGRQRVGLSDDEESVYKGSSTNNASCAACRTRESKLWWKAPKGFPTNLLCETCGATWRKYADLNFRPVREESLPLGKGKAVEKRDGTPLAGPSTKRARASVSDTNSTPPPNQHISHVRCLACLKNGPVGKVVKCKQCQFRVHASACGVVVDPSSVDAWLCDICRNESALEASSNSDCLLCPRPHRDAKKKISGPAPDSYLRACKPTEGQGWAHVLCSVFIPELSFTDATLLRKVEGISALPQFRWTTPCALCDETGGAVLRCSDCPKMYHISCAWRDGLKFGFEIQPVKGSRKDTTTVVNFSEESGLMAPVVSCKEHNNRREIYGLCQTNEAGESAMQVYCKYYKQAQTSQAHDLLRKARRLDGILNLRSDASLSRSLVAAESGRCRQCPSTPSDLTCEKCKTEYSPLFHRQSRETWWCHQCQWEENREWDDANGSPDSWCYFD